MKKVLFALILFAMSVTANAVTVELISYTGGALMITDGSVPESPQASTAIFDWDGSTLTSSGLFSAVFITGEVPPTISSMWLNDKVTDLTISTDGTPGGTASASTYSCVDGRLPIGAGFRICGNYSFGANDIDESVTVWGPGLAVSQTLGGDDVSFGAPRTISVYDFGFDGYSGIDGLSPGDLIFIGNGIEPGSGLEIGERMTFQVVPVPTAAWLFGSALGLLGWMRRKVA